MCESETLSGTEHLDLAHQRLGRGGNSSKGIAANLLYINHEAMQSVHLATTDKAIGISCTRAGP